jgi:hypothetical protein
MCQLSNVCHNCTASAVSQFSTGTVFNFNATNIYDNKGTPYAQHTASYMNLNLFFVSAPPFIRSRDSSVGIATGYGLDDQGDGSSSPSWVKNFHFSISSRPALGSTQPPIKWVPGLKRQGHEADHSPIHLHGVLLN